jgi:hypothetical protein
VVGKPHDVVVNEAYPQGKSFEIAPTGKVDTYGEA